MSIKLNSRAFANEGMIPNVCSKKGGNLSPELSWSGVPEGTRSLALVMDDPDAPSGLFTHWLVYGLEPNITCIPEGATSAGELPNGAREGRNGFRELGYGGPQPPSGTHRYFFHLYALDIDTAMPAGLTRQEVDGAIQGHVIEEGVLMGRYEYRERSRGA